MPSHSDILVVTYDSRDAAWVDGLLQQVSDSGFKMAGQCHPENVMSELTRRPLALVMYRLACAGEKPDGTIRELIASHPDVAIVVFGAQAEESQGDVAVAAGAQDFVIRGAVGPDRFVAMLRKALSRQGRVLAACRQMDAVMGALRAVNCLLPSGPFDRALERALREIMIRCDADFLQLHVFTGSPSEPSVLTTLTCQKKDAAISRLSRPHPVPPSEAGISGWMQELVSGRLVVARLRDLPEADRRIYESSQTVTFMAAPVLVLGQAWGVLVLGHTAAHKIWNETEREVLTGFVGVLGEVVRRNGSEEALMRSRALLAGQKLALDNAAFVLETDPEGVITYVNERFLERTQYTREEVIGRSCNVLNSGFHQKTFFKRLWTHITQGYVWQGEILNKDKSGNPYWVETTISPVFSSLSQTYPSDGRIVKYIAVQYDITERKRAEEALMISESRLALIFNGVSDLLFLMKAEAGPKLRCLKVNQSFLHVTGLVENQLQGKLVDEILPEEARNFVYEKYQEVTRLRKPIHYEEVLEVAAGDIIVETLLTPIFNERGECTHLLGASRDITERKRIEAERREDNRKLQQAYLEAEQTALELTVMKNQAMEATRAKSAFLANMSHEIRTPLNGIIGMISLLQELEMPAEQREYVEVVAKSSEHLLELVNEILDFSKVEAGKMQLEEISFDLLDVVGGVVQLLSHNAEFKGLKLVTDFEESLRGTLRGDPARVRQVLTNLIGNAIKFSSTGHVVIRVQRKADLVDGSRIGFEIIDSGIGIPREALPKLFQSFSQADDSTTRKYGGTGLGLAIVKQIVELMGGAIGVHSEPGRGSTFWFEVPFKKDVTTGAAVSASTGVGISAGQGLGMRLLLVEDNLINQKVAVQMAERLGYAVDVAESGFDALEHLSRQNYDAVLMDCQMPGMDGYEATRQLRLREANARHTPVIAMTAHAIEGDREKCLAAGMDDYIAKPVRLEQLAAILEKWNPRVEGAMHV